MRPYDSVILNEDLPEDNLKAGTKGAIVDAHSQLLDVFMVEWFDENDQTIDVVPVRAHQITVTLADFYDGEQIALLHDLLTYGLLQGQVGTIKKRTGIGVYTVEFVDTEGHVYAQVTLHANQMMLLRWQPVAVK